MLQEIKNYRQELMGVATLMIYLGHTVFYGPEYVNYGFMNDVITLGYAGVDIFLFLSGFGLFFSISKNSRSLFYNHRLHRLLPSIVGIWVLFVVVNIDCFSFVTLINPARMMINGGYWYIGFIVIAYLCYPYLYSFSKDKNGWLILVGSILFSFVLLTPFLYQGTAVSSNAKVCIVTRIPIFVMGMLYAMGKMDILNNVFFNMLLLLIGLLSLYPFYVHHDLGGNEIFTTYYSIFFITSPVIYFCSKFLGFIGGSIVLRKLGGYSLEIYLVQVTIMMQMMAKFHHAGMNTTIIVISCFFIIVFISIILKYLTDKIFNSFIWSK